MVAGSIGALAGQFAEAGQEVAELIERRDRHELVLLAQCEVFLAATGGDVDDARPFGGADRLPGDDAMDGLGALSPAPSFVCERRRRWLRG